MSWKVLHNLCSPHYFSFLLRRKSMLLGLIQIAPVEPVWQTNSIEQTCIAFEANLMTTIVSIKVFLARQGYLLCTEQSNCLLARRKISCGLHSLSYFVTPVRTLEVRGYRRTSLTGPPLPFLESLPSLADDPEAFGKERPCKSSYLTFFQHVVIWTQPFITERLLFYPFDRSISCFTASYNVSFRVPSLLPPLSSLSGEISHCEKDDKVVFRESHFFITHPSDYCIITTHDSSKGSISSQTETSVIICIVVDLFMGFVSFSTCVIFERVKRNDFLGVSEWGLFVFSFSDPRKKIDWNFRPSWRNLNLSEWLKMDREDMHGFYFILIFIYFVFTFFCLYQKKVLQLKKFSSSGFRRIYMF